MKAQIARMSRLAESRALVACYLATGDRTPLVMACDALEEAEVPVLVTLARCVRTALLGA